MQMKKRTWLAGIGLVTYSGFIFYLSSIPGSSIGSLPFSDKTIHFFLYFGLGSILAYFLKNLKPDLFWVSIGTTTFFFSLFYGLSDEIHQLFVPGRLFDMADLLADTIGGVSGGLLIIFLYEFIQKSDTSLTK